MRKISLKIMTVIMIITVLSVLCPQEFGVNVKASGFDTTSATVAEFGREYSGYVVDDSEKEVYKLVLPASGQLSAYIESDIKSGVSYEVYDETSNQLEYMVLGMNEPLNQVQGTVSDYFNAGTYYIVMSSYGRSGNYNVKFTFNSMLESFPESNNGNNNDIPTSSKISCGITYYGMLTLNDENDIYAFTIPTSGTVQVTSQADCDALEYNMYDTKGDVVVTSSQSRNQITNSINYSYSIPLNSGTYYLEMKRGKTGSYSFKVDFASAYESFPETGADDYLTGANPINLGVTYSGQIAYKNQGVKFYNGSSYMAKDVDYYVFNVFQGGAITINVSSQSDLRAEIYDDQGNSQRWIDSSKVESLGRYDINETLNMMPGTYYLSIRGDSGNYSFQVSQYVAPKSVARVSISKAKSKKKHSITLNWKKVEGASGYQIQYSKYKNFRGKKSLWVGSTINKKTIRSLKSKKKYYVRVRAYTISNSQFIYGKFSKARKVKVK